MKAAYYVLKENIINFYRTISIAKYELLADMRESRLGLFWNIANPLIQLFTFWLVFGIGLRGGRAVGRISYLPWMLVGMTAWFFISPCITQGVNCIYNKRNIITKMKFPISILPATITFKELFNHLIMLGIILTLLIIRGHHPNIYWLWLIYYVFCAICLTISLSMLTSVLNMFTRDVKKLVLAFMRMLMYLTPILWTMEKIEGSYPMLVTIMKANPLYYIVEGYRGSIFFNKNPLIDHPVQTLFFWGVVIILYLIGSNLMYKFKMKFIDML